MATKTDLSTLNCSLAGALSLVGDGWSLLIIRDALLGVSRFGEFQKSLGLARNILAHRLRRLVDDGILFRGGSARRPTYGLTKKGEALAPAIIALMQWGDRWVSMGRAPIIVTDQNGQELAPIVLEAGGRAVSFGELRFRAGEGAQARTGAFLEWMAPRLNARA
jgi:DNA-binding HxlR family transcriptional regulator